MYGGGIKLKVADTHNVDDNGRLFAKNITMLRILKVLKLKCTQDPICCVLPLMV